MFQVTSRFFSVVPVSPILIIQIGLFLVVLGIAVKLSNPAKRAGEIVIGLEGKGRKRRATILGLVLVGLSFSAVGFDGFSANPVLYYSDILRLGLGGGSVGYCSSIYPLYNYTCMGANPKDPNLAACTLTNLVNCPLGGHLRFALQYSPAYQPSKYSLIAPLNTVPTVSSTIAMTGRFPIAAGSVLYVYAVSCSANAANMKLVLRQKGGAGWAYTFACANGQSAAGTTGLTLSLFNQTLTSLNRDFEIVEQNTVNAGSQTVEGFFVISTSRPGDWATGIPTPLGLNPATQSVVQVAFSSQIPQGATLYVWYVAGFVTSCSAPAFTPSCFLEIRGVPGSVPHWAYQFDVCGGSGSCANSFFSSGSLEATAPLFTYTPTGISFNNFFIFQGNNSGTGYLTFSGMMLVSMY